MQPPKIRKVRVGVIGGASDTSNTFEVNDRIKGRHPNRYKVVDIQLDENAFFTHHASLVEIFVNIEDKSRSTEQQPVFGQEKLLWKRFYGQPLEVEWPFNELLQEHEHTVRTLLNPR
jgi:hypothetical protein